MPTLDQFTADSTVAALFAQLNAEPADRQLLLVIADRFDELEMGSGAGWRVLVSMDRRAFCWEDETLGWVQTKTFLLEDQEAAVLPTIWFRRLPCLERIDESETFETYVWAVHPKRGTARVYAEAALAFLRLPEKTKTKLLSSQPNSKKGRR